MYGYTYHRVNYAKIPGVVTISARAILADIIIKPKTGSGRMIKNMSKEVKNVMGPKYVLGVDFQAQERLFHDVQWTCGLESERENIY
jgi:hypothetical protein